MEGTPLSFGFWKLAEAVVECEGPDCEPNFFCVNIHINVTFQDTIVITAELGGTENSVDGCMSFPPKAFKKESVWGDCRQIHLGRPFHASLELLLVVYFACLGRRRRAGTWRASLKCQKMHTHAKVTCQGQGKKAW